MTGVRWAGRRSGRPEPGRADRPRGSRNAVRCAMSRRSRRRVRAQALAARGGRSGVGIPGAWPRADPAGAGGHGAPRRRHRQCRDRQITDRSSPRLRPGDGQGPHRQRRRAHLAPVRSSLAGRVARGHGAGRLPERPCARRHPPAASSAQARRCELAPRSLPKPYLAADQLVPPGRPRFHPRRGLRSEPRSVRARHRPRHRHGRSHGRPGDRPPHRGWPGYRRVHRLRSHPTDAFACAGASRRPIRGAARLDAVRRGAPGGRGEPPAGEVHRRLLGRRALRRRRRRPVQPGLRQRHRPSRERRIRDRRRRQQRPARHRLLGRRDRFVSFDRGLGSERT